MARIQLNQLYNVAHKVHDPLGVDELVRRLKVEQPDHKALFDDLHWILMRYVKYRNKREFKPGDGYNDVAAVRKAYWEFTQQNKTSRK